MFLVFYSFLVLTLLSKMLKIIPKTINIIPTIKIVEKIAFMLVIAHKEKALLKIKILSIFINIFFATVKKMHIIPLPIIVIAK